MGALCAPGRGGRGAGPPEHPQDRPGCVTPRRCRCDSARRSWPRSSAQPGLGGRRRLRRGDRAAEHLPRVPPRHAPGAPPDRRLRPRAGRRPQDRGLRGRGRPYTSIVDGDASSYAIACASIVAKVTRDRLMRLLALRYPGYGWERNAGYATRDHVEGLQALGLTPFHRRTYQRIRRMLEGEQLAMDLDTAADASDDGPAPVARGKPDLGDGYLEISGAKREPATLPR